MKWKSDKKFFDNLFLLAITSASIILSLVFNGNKLVLKIIVLALSFTYLIWGVWHHKKEGTFHREVVFEYLLLAMLGSLLVIGLI